MDSHRGGVHTKETPTICSEIVQFMDAPQTRTDTSELQVSKSQTTAEDPEMFRTPSTCCPESHIEVGEEGATPSASTLVPRQLEQAFDALAEQSTHQSDATCATVLSMDGICDLEKLADHCERMIKEDGFWNKKYEVSQSDVRDLRDLNDQQKVKIGLMEEKILEMGGLILRHMGVDVS